MEPKILALRVNDKDNVATLFSNGAEQGLQAEVAIKGATAQQLS